MTHRAIRLPRYRVDKLPQKGWLAVVFFVFFLAGILAANCTGKETLVQYGILNDYYVGQLAFLHVDAGNYMRYLFCRRMRRFLPAAVLSLTQFGRAALLLAAAWYGFSLGYLLVGALMCMGIRGMAFVVVSGFPQIVFYALAFYLLAGMVFRTEAGCRMEACKGVLKKGGAWTTVGLSFLCLIVGIWLEGSVGLWLLKKFVQVFG